MEFSELNMMNLNLRFRFGVQQSSWTEPEFKFSIRRKKPWTWTEPNLEITINDKLKYTV
jgi:hypothetical protein